MKKSENLRVRYKVTDDPDFARINAAAYDELKKKLHDTGIYFNVEDGKLDIWLHSQFEEIKTRNAGRRRSFAWKSQDLNSLEGYRFSDIVCMMQTMTDQQIMDKIGMKLATFYRHKKVLKASSYYASLDKNRLSDLEYLNSVEENYLF